MILERLQRPMCYRSLLLFLLVTVRPVLILSPARSKQEMDRFVSLTASLSPWLFMSGKRRASRTTKAAGNYERRKDRYCVPPTILQKAVNTATGLRKQPGHQTHNSLFIAYRVPEVIRRSILPSNSTIAGRTRFSASTRSSAIASRTLNSQ